MAKKKKKTKYEREMEEYERESKEYMIQRDAVRAIFQSLYTMTDEETLPRFRLAAEAVYAWLDTLKRSDIPEEYGEFVQHILIVYLDYHESETDREILAGCEEEVCGMMDFRDIISDAKNAKSHK